MNEKGAQSFHEALAKQEGLKKPPPMPKAKACASGDKAVLLTMEIRAANTYPAPPTAFQTIADWSDRF